MSPARRRSKENSPAKQRKTASPTKAGKIKKAKGRTTAGKSSGKANPPKRKGPRSRPDPSDTPDSEVRFIQPYDASKVYLCPGCLRDIAIGLGHVVAVPPDAPDLRRHWHRGCWDGRASRR